MKRNKNSYMIQTVDKALELMEQFQDDVEELGVKELGRRLQLAPNRVFRLLATLESRNYIEQNEATKGYRLGIKTHLLGRAFVEHMLLLRQARPVQESLVRMCKETSYVSIRKEFRSVYLEAVETDLPVRVASRIGSKYPLHCTEAGKVFATQLSDEDLKRYLSRELQSFTPNTINDPERLAEQLREAAACGYAVDNEESEIGVTCVGTAVRDRSGAIVGAVSISGPTTRLTPKRVQKELIPLLKDAGQLISIRLGYS